MSKLLLVLLTFGVIVSGNPTLHSEETKPKQTKPPQPQAAPAPADESPTQPSKQPKQESTQPATSKSDSSKPDKAAAKPKPLKVPAFIARSQNFALKIEIDSLASALFSYKTEFGEYPPDFSAPDEVRSHVRLRWPRIKPEELERFVELKLNPAQALVFWLQGFTGDPKFPMTGKGTRIAMYEFDKRRLQGDPAVYIQQHGPEVPLLYFSSVGYATADYEGKKPYQDDAGKYINPDGFQIICAGLDGDFGSTEADVRFPSGTGFAPADFDNITDFSNMGTLKASME